jgi:hypothetical protein
MAKKKFLFDWTGYFAKHLSTATVETAAADDVVLTFVPAMGTRVFRTAVAGEFALSGKTISGIALDEAAGTLTVTVTVAYAAGANFNLTFNPTQKGDTVVQEITNNVV